MSRELAGAAAALTAGDLVFRDEIVRTGADFDRQARLSRFDQPGDRSDVARDARRLRLFRPGQRTEDDGQPRQGAVSLHHRRARQGAYVISTPTASIGVRGTVLDIGGPGPQQMRVTLSRARRWSARDARGSRSSSRCGTARARAGRRCECLALNHAGQTAQVKKSGGANQATFISTPVDFASLCSGGSSLCSGASYASLTPGGGGGRRLPIGGAMRTLGRNRRGRGKWPFALRRSAPLVGAAELVG